MVQREVGVPGVAGPCPHGLPLVIDVTCRTNRRSRGVQHRVTVHSDWSVDTGHDLDAERIGVAFGGQLSCLDLVDKTVPALRAAVQLWTRTALPPIMRVARGWALETPCTCRMAATFKDARSAAAHARSPEHLARAHGCDLKQLTDLIEAALDSYGDLLKVPGHDAARLVREPWGLSELWDAGISPHTVADLHERLWPDGEAFPSRFYLFAAVLRPDDQYLASVIDATKDADTATWAAMTEKACDRRDPHARARWLALGTSRPDVEELIESRYTVACAIELSQRTGTRVAAVARVLAAWSRAGCSPDLGELARLHDVRDRDGWYAPAKQAIDRLMIRCLESGVHPTRAQAGLVLAVAGTVPAAFRAIELGARDASTAVRIS